MNAFIKQTGQRWLAGAVKNPKRFYMYSMIFLSVSFTGSLIQGIFFPSDTSFKIKPLFFIPTRSSVRILFQSNIKKWKRLLANSNY
jgi:hypothetical protein